MIKTIAEYENGGKIDVYAMVDTSANDYKNVFACCDYFAQQGAHVIITPRFGETIGNPDYQTIYASLKNTQYWGRCPDFSVNGVWYEHEGYDESKDLSNLKKKASTFSKMISRGLKQSNRIIVEDCGAGHSYASRNIYNRVQLERQNIEEIYLKTSDGLSLLYKK